VLLNTIRVAFSIALLLEFREIPREIVKAILNKAVERYFGVKMTKESQ
jgi:hypothetical protein